MSWEARVRIGLMDCGVLTTEDAESISALHALLLHNYLYSMRLLDVVVFSSNI
jgi:hypothetical protein